MLAAPAQAAVKVVATLPWIGNLAREVGRDKVTVTTLVKPSQDPHTVEAKPSMIIAGRKADIFMYNGLDLEIGYLPLILESAKNPAIMPGTSGNFDCSKFVRVIEKHTHADRSMGDLHHLGNPHYHYSASNIVNVAEGISGALAAKDPANAAFYRNNYKNFASRVAAHEKKWRSANLAGKRYIAHHKMFEYMALDYDFFIVAYIEPKPGIPPSAAYLESLIELMNIIKPDGILVTGLSGQKEAEFLSQKTGVKVKTLPADTGAMPGTDDWISFMDTVINKLKQ